MKVIAINSSKRKGNTYHLLLQIKQHLEKEHIEVEIVHLHDYQIASCIGCEVCLRKGECMVQDDTKLLMEKLMQSDGIILSSPVYMQAISGKLKTFIDRTCSWYHRPALYGKPFLSVATTMGSGLRSTLSYIEKTGIQWGCLPSGKIGKNVVSMKKDLKEQECSLFIKNLKKEMIHHHPSFSSILNYNIQKAMSQNLTEPDKKYWKEKGWLSLPYYYPCKINPIKKAIGNTTYKTLNKILSKAQNT